MLPASTAAVPAAPAGLRGRATGTTGCSSARRPRAARRGWSLRCRSSGGVLPDPLVEAQAVRPARRRRLGAPPVHDAPRPPVSPAARRRDDRDALAAAPRSDRVGRARATAREGDLPDRVRDPEPARPVRRRERDQAGGVPLDRRAYRLAQPARSRVLPVPDARRPAARRPRHRATAASSPASATRTGSASVYRGFRLPLTVARRSGRRGSTVGPGAAGARAHARHYRVPQPAPAQGGFSSAG